MGDRWLQETPSGPNRLFDRDDWVRAELELALEERKKIAPVLLSSVRMPKPADLPEPIRPFASIKAFELSDTRYEYDLGQLVGRLAPYVPAAMADAGRGIQKIDWRSFGWEGVLDASPEKVLRLAEMALREHFAGTDLKKKKLRIQGVVKYPGTFTDNSYLTVTAEPRGTQARTVIHSKRYTLWEGRSDREGKNVSEMLAWFRQAGVRSV
jgi:hypothetical protein